MHQPSRPRHLLAVAAAAALAACGGSAGVTDIAEGPLTIKPPAAQVPAGQTVQFQATAQTGTVPTLVWSVAEPSGCGNVSSGGLYTAPGSAAACHIVVSTTDLKVSAQAAVTVTTVPVTAPGNVVAVTASPATASVTASGTLTFTAAVAGSTNGSVTWAVAEPSGCGSIDQTGRYTAPATSGICHVVATSLADVGATDMAAVSVVPAGVPAGANQLGVNVGAPMVWDATAIYADALRQGVIEGSAVDAAGWPLGATFTAIAANDLGYANGRWTVYFDGTATVTGRTINGPGGIGPDGLPNGANTRWFQLDVTGSGRARVSVAFTNAARNDGSGLAGLTNIRMMRPVAQGALKSNRRDETMHRQVRSLVRRFGTVRYMDFLGTNWSQITTWGGAPWTPGRAYQVGERVTVCTSASTTAKGCGKVYEAVTAGTSAATPGSPPSATTWNGTVVDGGVTWRWVGFGRPLPLWSGFDRNEGSGAGDTAATGADFGWQGSGGPYEDVIKMANESGTDPWINLPVQADDDYFVKVAQLFAFGSDGVLPYTGPAGSTYDAATNPRPAPASPLYPPLSTDRKLYIEYSNEIWLAGGFSQNRYVAAMSTATGLLQYQFVGRQVAKISKAFRAAFGDAAMPYTGSGRIRPVVMGQGAQQDQTVGHALKWIHEVLGDGDGADHTADRLAAGFDAAPHPVRWWVYGSGGAAYWGASGADAPSVLSSMSVASIHDATLAKLNRHASIYGLPVLAYEGGPEVPQSAIGTAANMTDRPATPNMRDVMVSHHQNWSASGGTLFVYFTLATDPRWVFVADDGYRGNIYAESPKLGAVDELRSTVAAPVTLTPSTFQSGAAVPGTLPGGAYAIYYADRTYVPPPPGTGTRALTATDPWMKSAGYTFLASAGASRVVSASLSGGGTVRCYVDGVKVGADQVASGTVTFGSAPLDPGIHGVILVAVSGGVTVGTVSVQ